jgi:eukaryotic-like serine/threonine-protein kinase
MSNAPGPNRGSLDETIPPAAELAAGGDETVPPDVPVAAVDRGRGLNETIAPDGAETGNIELRATTLRDTARRAPDETVAPTVLTGPQVTVDLPAGLAGPAGLNATIDSIPSLSATGRSAAAAQRPQVEGYTILSELGRGGMGVVYKARQKKLNRIVALKMVLAGAHAGPDQLARFYAEAQAVAHLQQPHIVQIYEVGEHAGLPYFSLEYVDGGSLSERIDGKPQPVEESGRIVELLARAIGYAHEQGIVHRDLKPANVLLSKAGEPKVTDFGLAKRLESDSSQTKSGTLMGTPNYMAPEQARGLVREVGPLADVYALGIILYEMLTGRTPFLGSSILDTLQQVRNHEPVPPSRLQPKVPRDLETICLKCLQKEPVKRYDSAVDLAEDLRRFLAGEPIVARPVSVPERLWRWCRRNKKVAALSAAVLLLLVSLAIGSTVSAVVVSRQAVVVRQQKDLAEKNEALAKVARDEAQASEKQAHEARQEAEANEQRAVAAQKQADQNAVRAERQRELAIGALDTLVTKVQTQLGDTARTFRLKRDLLETAFEGLNKVAAGSDLASEHADATKAEAHLRMGRIFVELGHADSGRTEFNAALDVYRKLVSAEPENPQLKYNFSRALSRAAGNSLLLGDYASAEKQAREALDLRLAEFAVRPTAGMARNLVAAHLQMGDVLRDQQRTEQADAEYQRALSLQRQLVMKANAKDRPGMEVALRTICARLGELYLLWKKDNQRAGEYFEQALAIAQAAADAPEASKSTRENLASTLSRLGMVKRREGEREAAASYFSKSLAMWQQLAAEEDPEVLLAQSEWALALGRAGEQAAAARQAEQLEKLSPDYARNLYNVACCYALCAGAVSESSSAGDPDARMQSLRDEYVAKAVATFERWVKLSKVDDVQYLRLDPDVDSLRDEPAFRALLDSVAAKPAAS